MNELEENKAIDRLLTQLINTTSHVPLATTFENVGIASHYKNRLFDRLKQEDLIEDIPYNRGRESRAILLSPQGLTIARIGYLNWQRQQLEYRIAAEQRIQGEEQRASLNTWATLGSAIVAALALFFSIYTYYSAANDSKIIEQRVQILETRVQSLESQHQR